MLSLDASMESLKDNRAHRYATCWKIERTDGVNFYFTDHDHKLLLTDGNTYTPAGGFDSSAVQKATGLQAQNLEIVGVLTNDAITHVDLKAGRYREAKITEMLVDWQYPWAGIFATNVYWVEMTQFTGEHWEVQIKGLKRLLSPAVGDVYNRECRLELGNTACGIDLDALKTSDAVDNVHEDEPKRIFLCNSLTEANDYYNYGYVEWTSGDNDGLKAEVKDWSLGSHTLWLQLDMPFDISIDDAFDIYPGCDKLKATCKDKFSNFDNYGGFPFIPGSDKVLKTPKAK